MGLLNAKKLNALGVFNCKTGWLTVNLMEAYKIRSFDMGWPISRNGFAIFLENRFSGALEQSSKCDEPLAQEVPKALIQRKQGGITKKSHLLYAYLYAPVSVHY